MTAPLFGILIVDRDPLTLRDLPGLVQVWLMDAGGFAMLGLAVYLLYALRIPKEQAQSSQDRAGVSMLMLLAAGAAILCYAVLGFLMLTRKGGEQVVEYVSDPGSFRKYVPPQLSLKPQSLALTLGGLFAVIGISAPFVRSLLKLRSRRVYAIAKLGFKEAVRNRVFLVFLFFLVPFLFPANWFIQIKPEDELRTMIGFSSLVTNLLLTLPAALLAALSIPNDIKNQNIYTIVTKPVERFELILGRFVGYSGLMTLALFAMTALGWAFITFGTTIDDKAKDETFKARVPLYGKLTFQSRRGQTEGINAGREFDYRRYIGGDPGTSQRAVWTFDGVPSALAGRPADQPVPLEFTFDIFRMTKGEENHGVDLEIRVTSWQAAQLPPADPKDGVWRWADPAKEQAYKKEAAELVRKLPGVTAEVAESNPGSVLSRAKPGTPAWAVVEKLAETHGYYEATGKEVFDYHPDSVPMPAGLFRFAAQGAAAGPDGQKLPRVMVAVKCVTRGQMLGMAEPDLFVLEGERSFTENYFKAAVGLWCRVVLIIGLAVCCSTYLAGIISFLAALLLFAGGYASDHLTDMASGKSYVGGPFKAMTQIMKAEQSTAQVDPNSPLTGAVEGLDKVAAWFFRRIINMVPDVYSYSWTNHLSEGFNVPATALLMNVVVLFGYLLPWFILGYYLIRSREVAA